MKRARVRISDHAVLRYLERVGGFSIEELRRDISQRVSASYVPGATGIVIDGVSYRISVDQDGPVVATILDASGSRTILPGRVRE